MPESIENLYTMKSQEIRNLIEQYLSQRYMMQLATLRDGKPWSCIVYYVADDRLNLYWASLPSRRHSQEIADYAQCAVSVPVQHQKDQKVVGIQAEGTAEIVEDPSKIKPIAQKYSSAFSMNDRWVEDFSNLKTKHRLYRFEPKQYVIFDEENFAGQPRQVITP